MPSKRKPTTTPITAHHHNDTRVNIPTEELRDFVADEEKALVTVLYPRDPSLDPQLVWKGKDEQDRADLSVPAVPVYIQETIEPQAIIENLRSLPSPAGRGAGGEVQMSFFADRHALEWQDRVDFYHHAQDWQNRMILGDSLLVMTSLAEKEGLKGQVQMIYLDPPYGIKFGSNWQVSTRKRDVKDGKAEDVTRQPEQVKAFRDTWKLGIHSYLAYLRDRLTAARDLLTETGSIFVQIGDENVHLVRCVMDEVFGSENFVAEVVVEKTAGLSMEYLDRVTDYLLWYGKRLESLKYHQLFADKRQSSRLGLSYYRFIQLPDGNRRMLFAEEGPDPDALPPESRLYSVDALTSQTQATTTRYVAEFQGRKYESGKRQWATPPHGMQRLMLADRVQRRAESLGYVRFYDDFPVIPIRNSWSDTGTGSFTDPKVYVVQTGTKIVERCLLMTTDPGDLVLDPTCGSGTTAYVAEQWGRRWITVDTSRVAIALARTRLMSARYPYYIPMDEVDPQVAQMSSDPEVLRKSLRPLSAPADLRKNFLYRRVPHVTLKSIANNEEIDAIHARWQEQLEPLRAEINHAAGKAWEEWEVPREVADDERLMALLRTWWGLRRDRQQEIDASIARHADTETLYDQPYEDGKRLRVAGPFTVESLSPHRVLPIDDEDARSDDVSRSDGFVPMILANLKAAGVQNTIRNERLKFDRLEPYAGTWIHAAGEYTEVGSDPVGADLGVRPAPPGARPVSTKRVAVCIGPEHGTVGPELVKEAAKEAVQGIGFDLLVVCGFAFDPHVSEETKRYGRLTVLAARMNPDLAMGDELLKRTGAGNLFMVFGEPDVEVARKGGKVIVTLRGVDVYDPTTGEIRSNSTDDIACWFIDTDYNGECFFVRHAYFTGADEPYEKLKRALRAEIDEGAWSALYQTTSLPFDPPVTGKIAVKVINHYGDEVMKVYPVS